MAVLERQPETLRGAARHREQIRILGLGEVDEALVVTEVHRLKLRVPVDPETADHEPLEVAGQEVRQPERCRLPFSQGREVSAAREELVAVGAGQPLDAFVDENRIEEAARPAIGVGDEDLFVAVPTAPADSGAHARGDPAGPVVEVGRQAGDLDVREVRGQGDELAAEGSAADHEDARGGDPMLHQLGLSHLRPRHVVRR